MEIVFVSSDRSEESFDQYFNTMPWLAVPFGDSRVDKMKNLFAVDGIYLLYYCSITGVINALLGRHSHQVSCLHISAIDYS